MVAPTLSSADKTFTAKELTDLTAVITRQILEVQKHNASGAVATNNPPYGPYSDGSGDYGVFSIPGIRPDMFSAFQRPRSFTSILGVRPSLNANEKIGIMTGVLGGAGTNPTGFCGTAPTGGQLKRCVQNYTFGKSYWKSQVVNVAESGEYADYADTEKRILNLNQSPNPLIPDIMGRLDISNRNASLLANELFTLGAEMEREFEIVLVRGNETTGNASTERGWIQEFRGLERQITTGKVDMNTQIACPAADSQVVSWGTGIEATVSGRTFPQMLVDTYFGLTDIAEQVGMSGTRWVMVMPMRMFRALTYVYACQYYTNRCLGVVGNPNFTNSTEIAKLQMDFWQGRYLLIDGQPVQVIFSDGIRETRAGGSVFTAQEMFILPVEWSGMNMLNLQYKPMDNAQAMEFANFVGPNEFTGVNNGMWLASKARTNFCMELLFAGKFRLIQDCPFLAARIDTIQYTFQAPFRSAYPTDTISYVDGGSTRWDGVSKVS
jgi:hypothetical protein